jgi:acyl-CoA thioester hydrolase
MPEEVRMAGPFTLRIAVRGYELDVNGHLNQAVYLQYAEHARWELLRAAGIGLDTLRAAGVMPVVLETTIRFRQELRYGEEVDVSCAFGGADGKTWSLRQEIRRTDGVVAADVTSDVGLLDGTTRRLMADPVRRFLSLASAPDVLVLDGSGA